MEWWWVSEFALKGRGFSRAVKCLKINRSFSRCGDAFFKLTHSKLMERPRMVYRQPKPSQS